MEDPIIMKREMSVAECFTDLSYININLTPDVIRQFNTFMDMITIDHNSHFVISSMADCITFAVIPKTLRLMTMDVVPYLVSNNAIYNTVHIYEFEAKTSDLKFITFTIQRNPNILNIKIERPIVDMYPTIFNTYERFLEQHNSPNLPNSLKNQIQVRLKFLHMFRNKIYLDMHPVLKFVLAMGISPEEITLGWKPLQI